MKKPTIQEVSDYCAQRGNGIDPEAFWDFYESKGWMIGKNKMKNWQCAVRTWERNQKQDRRRQNAPRGWQADVGSLGSQMGIEARPGESWEAYGARVRSARGRAH